MQLIHSIFEPRGDGPHPTILALHGWGANALDLLGLAPYLCGGRFLVLCPQGPVQTPIGPGMAGYGWFPSTRGGPLDLSAVQSAREHLVAFLDAALTRYPIDPHKLILLGFSQGGVMTYTLGLSAPARFAALAALSTWLPSELAATLPAVALSQHPPVFVQHGSRDEMIEVGRARQSIDTLQQHQVPATYREYDMGHEINARSLSELSAWLEERVLSPVVIA
jgi:phospholipase/carboxylesterase